MQFQRCSIDVGWRAAHSVGIAVRTLVVSLLSDSYELFDRRLRVVAEALFVLGREFRNADLSKFYLNVVRPSTSRIAASVPSAASARAAFASVSAAL